MMKTRKNAPRRSDPNQLSFFDKLQIHDELHEPRIVDRKDFILERRRVRQARIIVNRQLQVRVIIPQKFTSGQVQSLIEEKSAWIEKQLQHFGQIEKARIRLAKNEILYQGMIYRFLPRAEMGGKVIVDHDSRIIFSGADLLNPVALEAWYRYQARRLIGQKVNALSRQYGFKFGKFTIRGQKTRWGSCSNKKNLSFNWRLIMAPSTIMDYIILHELVHTGMMNHSPAYWARLSSVYPKFQSAKSWLKANSWLLD
jgi:predicted metal-dependent hydrolase